MTIKILIFVIYIYNSALVFIYNMLVHVLWRNNSFAFRNRGIINSITGRNLWRKLNLALRIFFHHKQQFLATHWNTSKSHILTGILTRIARAILTKIPVEMCQFTRLPMTRFEVLFRLQNSSQRRNIIFHVFVA